MTREEFGKVQIGDMVVITVHGQNYGKKGIVFDMHRDKNFGTGWVYLEPYECEFTFSNPRKTNKDGFYIFRHPFIGYPKKETEGKTFCISQMDNMNLIEWPTTNFTDSELKVIDRFLEELNKHIDNVFVDKVTIFDEGVD
jgi:hypothetical protein